MDRYRQQPRGPQIHAVPDSEKYVDNGKKLPWAYDTVTTSVGLNDERSSELPEKGPFGRASGRRRGTSRSRSKTAEPAQREEDRARLEQMRGENKVFGSLGRKAGKDERGREVLGEVDQNAVSQADKIPAAVAGKVELDGEATEVMLYGFGDDLQWAAIDFYERVSGGSILEDYDRVAPGARGYEGVARSYSRSGMHKSLSKAAIKKKNTFAGGEHWIKVTFSSRGAAELAIARAPHIVRGYMVFAEPWQGRGPARDEATPATMEGAMIMNEEVPPSFSTNTLSASPSTSQTLESSTERETPSQGQTQPTPRPPWGNRFAASSTCSALAASSSPANNEQTLVQRPPSTISRVQGARVQTLLPAEQALMPKQPRKSVFAWIGGSELIGSTVPRKEDGSFDRERASWYWLIFFLIDSVFGTDFCGLKGDE
ncbi:hypothetical protein EJ03DRAFT_92397 [Teratosphaeria nubilosa]|uniref:Uncharacterized protein n=1 Tax=Teratosphaeria nubilosa TaxID=161662 RepID=A0A6G1L9C7_9PEZI|nr:hypothetical protein EJ03DRAFT_92397 [Teratosphaeria nubilosa]